MKAAIGLIDDLERRGIARPHETIIVEILIGEPWDSAQSERRGHRPF